MPLNPRQTASPLFRILFLYLDSIVWKAWHVPHLPLSELPPLADEDQVKNLVRIAFPHCDPLWKTPEEAGKEGTAKVKKASGHWRMLLALVVVFRREIMTSCFLLACQTAALLLSPYSLRHLLMYLETSGEGAIVRPWFWALSVSFVDLLFSRKLTATWWFQVVPCTICFRGAYAELSTN